MIGRVLAVVMLLVALRMTAQSAFIEQEVLFSNATAGITIGGTLTLPANSAPRAALLLATGSGAQNRDEELQGHKPFKTIAEYLSSNGYAVLRIDDRGVGQTGGDHSTQTVDDYVTDLTASLSWLNSRLGVSVPKGVLGHSEGGTAAIKTAISNDSCRFIITLGAPAWEGDSLIMSQSRALAMAMTGRWEGEHLQRQIMNLVKSDIPEYLLGSLLYSTMAQSLGEIATMPQVQEQLKAQVDVLCSVPYRSMIKYDPIDDISAVKVPWLALNGDRDMQVVPGNLETIKSLNPQVTTCLLPGHNHLLQQCSMGLPQEYASIPEDISAVALETIKNWLDAEF